MLFDSHVHLNDDTLYNRIDEVLLEARQNDVTHFLCVGYDVSSSKRAIEISRRYEFVYAAIGFHPSEAKKISDEDFKWLEENLKQPKVVAIGEIGLDYYWDSSFKDIQKNVFIKQIELGNKYQLPLIIHMREATLDTYELLKNNKDLSLRGIMHCYSGSLESMKQFIHLNMMISLAGPVTFKNAKIPKEIAKEIDLRDLLIETDAPYLAPMPFRGKPNESKYLKFIAFEIASIKGLTYEEVGKKTFQNACELFKINI
ncbi:MAG: TatD family hydrolase [Firmicutes bacterium]|nr:TatD family hydrolase [Bacillota bacterium]